MSTIDGGMDAECFFFFIRCLNCCCETLSKEWSIVGGNPTLKPQVEPLWVKNDFKFTKTPKHEFLFSDWTTLTKLYRKWTISWCGGRSVELHTRSPDCPFLSLKQLQQSDLQSWYRCKRSHSMFVVWFSAIDRGGNTQREQWKKCWSACVWQFHWHSVCSTSIFVCLRREREFGRKRNNH